MGGTALGYEADRYTNDELNQTYAQVCDYLLRFNKNLILGMVKSYKNKETHGDLDIVVLCHDEVWEKLKKLIKKDFSNCNDNTMFFSLPWSILGNPKRFQVDLIKTNNINAALNYYNFNDLGNLVGRLAHLTGFKYGHEGLKYVLRAPGNDTKVVKEILVSQDQRKIYSFLGLNYYDIDCMYDGFANLEDIFNFVASSKYFHPDIYLFENVNAKSRIRDRKRNTYNAFLDYCNTHEFKDKIKFDDNQKEAFRVFKMHEAMNLFHGFREEYNISMDEYARSEFFKTLLNGDIVTEVTGLIGKDLGIFISKLKKRTDFNVDEFVENPAMVKGWIYTAFIEKGLND